MPDITKAELDAAVEGQTIVSRFLRTVQAHPQQVALREKQDDGSYREWTYQEHADRVAAAAFHLRSLGVAPGDRVVLMMRNVPDFHFIDLAVAALGATAISIYNSSSPDQVEYLAGHCGAMLAIVEDDAFEERFTKVQGQLPALTGIVNLSRPGVVDALYGSGTLDLEAELGNTTPDTLATVIYTSGTTGPPKGVMLSHHNMVTHTINAHDGWEFAPGDKSMVAMPLFHVGGSSYVLFGIHDGVPSVMTRDPDGASLAGAILAGANRTFLVPAVLAQVLQAGPDAVKLFGALKTYTYGAAPMPPPLLRAAMEAWPDTDFIQVYGLTEVAGVATHLMPEEHRTAVADGHPERLVSAGRPIPGVEVRIVSPDTLEDLPTGEHGEIWLKTEQLMKGFLGKPEETAKVITDDGWFRTGDMGKVDADGFVFVQDRLKDMIISGGENIYSPEVERVLAEHPAVAECAVIGVPDDTWGETVKAVVALKPDMSATEDEIIAYCRDHLAHFKCPKSVDILEALPRNPTGKILKKDLRKPYWEGRDRAVN